MAVSVADMNQIRVDVLGRSVDQPGANWTTAPPAAANTLNTTQRILNRAINDLNLSVGNALNGTEGFDSRFNGVVGNEEAGDQAAFASLGMNLIQAVAALVAGGGISPAVTFEFAFPDPITTGDFVEVTVAQDCTIAADLAGAEYDGVAVGDDMIFDLTVQPADDLVGDVEVLAGDNQATLSGIGGEIPAGTVLRMTAEVAGGASVSPGAVIKIAAERKAAPTTAGRFEFTQSVADTTWTIPHNLGQRIVAVQIVDDGGTPVLADVDFETANRCLVTFARPKAGTAVIRR